MANVWRNKSSASRVLAALASPPATKALDPDLYSRHSLRHAVYAILLQFGVETAGGLIQVAIGFAGGSGCFLTEAFWVSIEGAIEGVLAGGVDCVSLTVMHPIGR